ncbi:MAG: nucleotidyltransferase family protein, partial [Actinomycetota bacterium]|nr:nucleotidyltransferase family protein [Actinomycetota bacterium]
MSGTPGWEQDGVAPGVTRPGGVSPAAQARVRVPQGTKGRDLVSRRALGRVLIATLGASGWDRWELDALLRRPAGVALVEAADRHGVVGYLREAARGAPNVHPQVAAALDSFYEQAVRTHLRALADLALIGPVLDARGVPWAVVKGPVLAETVYSRFDLRAYRDLDVLVAPAAFPDALR